MKALPLGRWAGRLKRKKKDEPRGQLPEGPGLRVGLALDRHGRCRGNIWGWLGMDTRPTQGLSERTGEGTSGSTGVTWPTGNRRGRDYAM